MRRELAWALAALVLGAALSASALYDGGPVQSAVEDLLDPGTSRATMVVVNNGTNPVDVTIEISQPDGEGDRVVLAWIAEAGRVTERRVSGLSAEQHTAWGRFTWASAVNGRQPRGDRIVLFDPRDCDEDGSVVVAFLVESTNGVTVPGPDDVRCA